MPIKFTNIKTGETRSASTEPMIAAYYNSGNQHPNAHQGQDFGWRLAPETIKRMREIKDDQQTLNTIASTFNVMLEDVKESHILHYISLQDAQSKQIVQEQDETYYERQYEDQLRTLEMDRRENKVTSSQNAKETNSDNATIEESPASSGGKTK